MQSKLKLKQQRGSERLSRRLLILKVSASIKYTVMEGRSSREGFKRCANHLESSRPTPYTSLMGTPSLIVDLAPLLVLHAASSWGHLTYRTDRGLKPSKPQYTSRIARQRTAWTERHHSRYGKIRNSAICCTCTRKLICLTCPVSSPQSSRAPPRRDRGCQNTCLNVPLAYVCRSALSREQWRLALSKLEKLLLM